MLLSKLKIAAAVLVVLAAAVVGVGAATHYLKAADPPPHQDAAPPAPKEAVAPAASEPWGTIEGQATWAGGDLPAPTPVIVDKDQAQCLKSGPIFKTDYVVNVKNKGVRWVVVWLVDADDYKKAPPVHPDLKEPKDKEVVLDQPCCQFEPHAVCLREGQTLIARNSGTVPHNSRIDSPGDNPDVNPLIPPGASISVPGWKADARPSLVSCGIHPWMSAYVRVFDHPYFAVTDEDGHFKIEKAPAGDFRIVAWQESVGYLDRGLKKGDPITIKPGGVTEVDFPVKPPTDCAALALAFPSQASRRVYPGGFALHPVRTAGTSPAARLPSTASWLSSRFRRMVAPDRPPLRRAASGDAMPRLETFDNDGI